MWKYLVYTAWRKLVYTHYPAVYNSHAEEKNCEKNHRGGKKYIRFLEFNPKHQVLFGKINDASFISLISFKKASQNFFLNYLIYEYMYIVEI